MSSTITIGTAPDSWGVWFPNDPEQVPSEVFLREVAEAGYQWIELGPYGYLPTDPAKLSEQLDEYGHGCACGHRFSSICTGLTHGTRMDSGHRRRGTDPSCRRKAHCGDTGGVAAPQDRGAS